VKAQHALAIVTFYWKYFREYSLQTRVLSPGGRSVGLQKFVIRIGLQFDKVRRRNDLFDLPEVNAFSYFRWHFNLWSMSGAGQVLFGRNDERHAFWHSENAPIFTNPLFKTMLVLEIALFNG
jgi:hypothetical protein